jgi:hypothetical protein
MKEAGFCYACEQSGTPYKEEGCICSNSQCSNFLGKCEFHSKEQITVVKFIKRNGWNFVEDSGEYFGFGKDGNIGIDIGDEDVVLVGESGDFARHDLTEEVLFWLIGRLIWNHSIAIDFKR